jgi:predicted PurR-regulated permease PerM
MSQPNRVSFGFVLAVLVLTGWLHLGVLLLSVLFSYFALCKLHFLKERGKWTAIVMFLALLAGVAYGLGFFINATINALPTIADKAMPAITQWAEKYQIRLPFTDLNSLKDQAIKMAGNEAKNIGMFANLARGATKEFIFLIVGVVVAIGLFINPRLEMDRPASSDRNNLYSLCCIEIGHRVARFYESFSIVMGAQVIISAIDTTLTGIFVTAMGLQYVMVAVGVTFLCGLLPVVGNLLSNVLVVSLGFMASPAKGVAALAFLVGIHQMEYFLNSKIIGGKIRSPLWLTLLGLVVGDSLMGVTGIILAPVILHYVRIEAADIPVHHEK